MFLRQDPRPAKMDEEAIVEVRQEADVACSEGVVVVDGEAVREQ